MLVTSIGYHNSPILLWYPYLLLFHAIVWETENHSKTSDSVFPFPTMFSKCFGYRDIKSYDCVLKDNMKSKQTMIKRIALWKTLCEKETSIITSKSILCKENSDILILSQTSPGFYLSAVQVLENTVGAISPFPTVFSTHLENFLPSSLNLELPSTVKFFEFGRV